MEMWNSGTVPETAEMLTQTQLLAAMVLLAIVTDVGVVVDVTA